MQWEDFLVKSDGVKVGFWRFLNISVLLNTIFLYPEIFEKSILIQINKKRKK